ncbi:MAG: hypothetical protein ABIL25_01315 [candidate division WOR-3 bacterium]
MDCLKVAVAVLAAAGAASGQWFFGCICSTDVSYATAYNNSHKLAAFEFSGMPGETLTLVFQSRDGVWSCLGVCNINRFEWTRPVMMYPGQNPGIDKGPDGDRHLVWEFPDTSSGKRQVYYRNFEYRMAPLDVSQSRADALHPDVWGDSAGIAHVVWEDYRFGKPAIYYRECNENGTQSDTFRVSTTTTGCCFFPSIEYFSQGNEMVVVWQQVDSASHVPYSIRRRSRVGGVWGSEVVLATHAWPLRHPSLDRGSPGESFACAWEDSSSGNMEAHFEGGNGGGYPTAARSTRPVLAHVGSTWSYLFWNENEHLGGGADIACHLYYFMTGWRSGTLRGLLPITEDVRHPNCLGATVVWTQGSTAPYKVMYSHFGYPVGVAEREEQEADGGLRCEPNPFRGRIAISLPLTANSQEGIRIYDTSGRCVRTLTVSGERSAVSVWDGADALGRPSPPGVYLVRCGSEVAQVVKY